MRFLSRLAAATAVLLLLASTAVAGEFEVRVKVDLADGPVRTRQTVETPTPQPPPRPVVHLTHDQPARVSWHVENVSKSAEFKDVLVHFFVVPEKEVGQKKVPPLTADVTYEGALTMDFKPHDDADWQWTLNIHQPGAYLLRVETIGLLDQDGHERYAAMDLLVE